jgi:hypothetical protein
METTNIILILLLVLFILTIIGHLIAINSQPEKTTTTTSTIIVKSNHPVHPIGGCSGTQYGCCPNGITAKANYLGSNCN